MRYLRQIRRRRGSLIVGCGLAMGLLACETSSGTASGTTGSSDAGAEDSGGSSSSLSFSRKVIEGLGESSIAGDNTVLRLGPSGLAMVYGYIPAGQAEQQIHYAAEGDWTPELVAQPGATSGTAGTLFGLGFDFVNGAPSVAYQGGDGDSQDGYTNSVYGSDLMLSQKSGGSWSERTLVDKSDEVPATCEEVQNYCNRGNVVGTYASLAASSSGFAVIYRDQHYGFADDDIGRADAELYQEGASPKNLMIDAGRSAGIFGDVGFTSGGAVFVAYHIEKDNQASSQFGVWAAVRSGSEWKQQRLSSAGTNQKVSVATGSDGTLYVAFYNSATYDLMLATSTDEGDNWTVETVRAGGKTGLYPSIIVDGENRPVISYQYCGPVTESSCPGSKAEVRIARKEGDSWAVYTVDDGQGYGGVGNYTSIALDKDGKLAVAFQDRTNGDLLIAREE